MGNTVLTLEWDGNGPAHSGQCTMRRTRKGFVVEDEVNLYGPFATIEAALAHGNFHFGGTPNPHLRCSAALGRLEPLRRAAFDLAAEPGGEVWINYVRFRRVDDGLVEVG